MPLLIAMEFKHSIIKVAITVFTRMILLALIALSRKFVLLEADSDPAQIAVLAGASVALGAVYSLLQEREERGQRIVRRRRI